MNQFEKIIGFRTEARVRYGSGEFNVLSAGDFVRCAVTGKPIALADLKYWSVERQEAYASAEIAMRRYLALRRLSSADVAD